MVKAVDSKSTPVWVAGSSPVVVDVFPFLDSIVVSIPACHAGGRGSIPRQGAVSFSIICLA